MEVHAVYILNAGTEKQISIKVRIGTTETVTFDKLETLGRAAFDEFVAKNAKVAYVVENP